MTVMIFGKGSMRHMMTLADLESKIQNVPREKIAFLPTPLQILPRFSKALGGPKILMKRDDLTGLALGGNKTRMFEYLLADARKHGADTLIGGAFVQSNYCRQLAAACRATGFEVELVLRKLTCDDDRNFQGNFLLDLLLGAKVHIISGDAEDQRQAMYRLAHRLEAEGKTPYVVRMANDGDLSLDAISYTVCFCEIVEQCQKLGIQPTHLYASSYDSTQAGLEVGNRALGGLMKIVGIAAETREGQNPRERMARCADLAAQRLDLPFRFSPDEIDNTTEYVGEGYGVVTREGLEMIRLLADTEGILLDPVYTGKAMAGLASHIKNGIVTKDDVIVFLHTGGTPLLFSYGEQLITEEIMELITYDTDRLD